MGLLACVAGEPSARAQDSAALRAYLLKSYPSLAYVDSYRRAFPEEAQGGEALWSQDRPLPALRTPADLVHALIGLEDEHVQLAGPGAGANETLGVVFRAAGDGSMAVWDVLDPKITDLAPGDVVLTVDGVPARAWLTRAAQTTFGGNRRSRRAQASFALGAGRRIDHEIAHLGTSVTLQIRRPKQGPRTVVLSYRPVDSAAIAAAINRPDLPDTLEVNGQRIATVRIGAFAPQHDPAFSQAADAAAQTPGTSDDQAMRVGFCAVVHAFIARVDQVARQSDALLLDLRGNLGGFDREARLLADALAPAALPRTFYVLPANGGNVRLKQVLDDPSCGHTAHARPLIVLTDAGTRSGGEIMAAWLWGAGALVVGERTIGAGGGRDSSSSGLALPQLSLNVLASENFTLFDVSGTLREGEMRETDLVALVSQDRFGPSRTRAYAIQGAGMRPDIELPTAVADLSEGGQAYVRRILTTPSIQRLLHPPAMR